MHFPDNNDRSGHICGRSCLFTQCLLRPTWRQTCNLTESVVYYDHRERSLGSMASRKER